jgi:hypothetical protein
VGIPAAGLIAGTDYNSPRQRVLGIITVRQHRDRTGYGIFGHPAELLDVEAAAAPLVTRRIEATRSSDG